MSNRRRYSGANCWIKDKHGNRSKENNTDVYIDSPENRRIMGNIIALEKEQDVIRKKITAETDKLSTVGPEKSYSEENED